jgi:hypothetical protein
MYEGFERGFPFITIQTQIIKTIRTEFKYNKIYKSFMKVIYDLKKKYCWSTPRILFVLVSYEDHRCHNSPNQGPVCFWEGDFQCSFDVFKVDLKSSKGHQCQWLKTIILNDHDYKKNEWTLINIPDRIRPYILSICGGPGYAAGYQQTRDLIFEMTLRISET